ncbi:hypothetical protein IF188_08240 [Microbacterium sp. NEAU-LLC]|uniref:Uncharacterized protein n=1 Tax=Microbacterium helvum TaxID=2773713 RepID=A0ABR8NRL1_9MICO|nr:hypothetical protein [Microbacterium helvum]MBD3941681.1 hypothetical protein [Microbacterium helvum]
MLRLVARLHVAANDLADDERGDVPGWVLITLMTAGLTAVRERVYFTLNPLSRLAA